MQLRISFTAVLWDDSSLNSIILWKDHSTIEEYGNDMYENRMDDENKKAIRNMVTSLVKNGCTEKHAVSEASLYYPEFTVEEIETILTE